MHDLEKAWKWREKSGVFQDSEAVRVFHGPGEGSGDFRFIALDRFQNHYWLTEWETSGISVGFESIREVIVRFLRERGAESIVGLSRPEKGVAPEVETLWGHPPGDRFVIKEGPARFWIQFEKTRHPGLFLDHQPLRFWLNRRMKGCRVLNTFSYTGSLSVAAALGGAEQVTTLDLSKPSIQWAQENFTLNRLSSENHRFIAGDVFEWFPRLKREGKEFDCIILDPPSFSHGKKQKFSTAKDLKQLHSLAMEVLAPEGVLITSINSAKISWEKFATELEAAGREKKKRFTVVSRIDLPETFPTLFGNIESRYLKGWILRST